MINPQLLQHLSRVRADEGGDDDHEVNVKLSVPELQIGSPNAVLLAVISLFVCVAAFATLDHSTVVSILLVLVIAEQRGAISVCWDSLRQEYIGGISRSMMRARKAKYLERISQLLGSMGAHTLTSESVLIEDDAWVKVAKPSCEALLKLLSIQCTFMNQCDEATLVLQSCSRFVASARPTRSLPLSLFRKQIHQVTYSNRKRLEDLLRLEVVHDGSESVPSTQNLRSIRMDTLQLLPALCESSLVHQDPRPDQLLGMALETEQTVAYLTGLLGSVSRGTTAGDCDDLLRQAHNLLSAFVVLEADFPSPQESSDVWTKALIISQTITSRLQELLDQGQPNDEGSSLQVADNRASVQDSGDNEINFQAGNSSSARADVALDLNEKLVQRNKTLVYSTTVAPRERFRRRKKMLSPTATHGHSLVTPIDFLDELNVRLRTLPPQPEVVEKDLP